MRPYGHINKFTAADRRRQIRREIEIMTSKRFPQWRIDQAREQLASLKGAK